MIDQNTAMLLEKAAGFLCAGICAAAVGGCGYVYVRDYMRELRNQCREESQLKKERARWEQERESWYQLTEELQTTVKRQRGSIELLNRELAESERLRRESK